MKEYDKNKESSYLKYWDVNYSYGWGMSQKLPVNNSEWMEDSIFDWVFNLIKISQEVIMKKVMKNNFLKLMLKIMKNT